MSSLIRNTSDLRIQGGASEIPVNPHKRMYFIYTITGFFPDSCSVIPIIVFILPHLLSKHDKWYWLFDMCNQINRAERFFSLWNFLLYSYIYKELLFYYFNNFFKLFFVYYFFKNTNSLLKRRFSFSSEKAVIYFLLFE